jgi:hypothetical protein
MTVSSLSLWQQRPYGHVVGVGGRPLTSYRTRRVIAAA